MNCLLFDRCGDLNALTLVMYCAFEFAIAVSWVVPWRSLAVWGRVGSSGLWLSWIDLAGTGAPVSPSPLPFPFRTSPGQEDSSSDSLLCLIPLAVFDLKAFNWLVPLRQ
jgi:hypothetical protein